jgi:hypothetical protein
MGKPSTGTARIYRGYLNETEYKWLLASSFEKAKKEFELEYPDVKFIKIKLWK